MAIRIMASGNSSKHSGYREFYVDTEADIAMLPTDKKKIAWGAEAFCIDGASKWVLNSQYVWVKVIDEFLKSSVGGLPDGNVSAVNVVLEDGTSIQTAIDNLTQNVTSTVTDLVSQVIEENGFTDSEIQDIWESIQ